MSNLAENPHLSGLLAGKRLTISPGFAAGLTLQGQMIMVGQTRPEGTVVGFCLPEDENGNIVAVVYDESKEGQDDALTTVDCRL